jgi:asparagine synthase (glutamine-hydrolysing)
MSGLAGVFYLDGRPLERGILDRMLESMAHRGPDGADLWSEGSIGLCHRMLHTTPESLEEKLPLVHGGGNFAITADARIDNREELFSTLDFDHPRNEVGDSDLILAAYKKWGELCPERLLGDFVFAIWDRRKQQVFCARDHMGVKPFYYYSTDNLFAFASEIEALLCVPEVPRRLNEVRVADFMVHNVASKIATFYEGIVRLVPAHSITVHPNRISIKHYWTLDPTRELRLGSDQEYAEIFYETFAEAVRCRLRSSFPVGCELSGGLDTSSVACVASELLAQERTGPLHTFSAVYTEAPESDESYFIDLVLAKGGFEPHKVPVEFLSPLQTPRRVLWDADEPSILGGLSMPWGLVSEANRQGVRILLNGYDGDTVVSHGIGRLAELAYAGRWITLYKEIDAFSRELGWSRRSILRSRVLKPLAPDILQQAWWVLHGRNPWSQSGGMYSGAINEDFARRIGVHERDHAEDGSLDIPESVRLSRRWHMQGLLHGVNQYMMEVTGKIGATLNVENRYPFFDRRLVELCLALPPDQKLSRGWARIVLRRALADVMPDEIRWRKSKGNLTPGLVWSLLMFDRKLVENTIFQNPENIEMYTDLDRLRQAYVGCASRANAEDVLTIIKTVALALWLRRAGFYQEQ